MKKFLIRLTFFLAPVLIIVGLWEYGLSRVTTSYSLKRAQLEAQAPDIQVLVLGGSFSLRGINPEYFSMKGYNVANVQQSLYYDSKITLKYLNKMPSLKVVLIAVSYNSLWWQVYGSDASFRDYYYADYWRIRYPAIHWWDINIYSKILHYGNYTAFKLALHGFNVDLVKGYHDNGWAVKMRESPGLNDSLGKALINSYKADFKKANLDSNMNYLRDLISTLNKRGVQPVIFCPPVSEHSYKFMNSNRVKTMDSAIAVLCNEYRCKWYDYTKDSRFSNSDFRDVGHLNVEGAAKFSKILNNEILEKYDTLAHK